MVESGIVALLGRRSFLLGAALAASPVGMASAVAAPSSTRGAPSPLVPASGPLSLTPAEALRVFRKLTCSETDGLEVTIHYSGVTFAVDQQGVTTPLYGMSGISPSRTFMQPDGSVRFLANEVGLFTDLASGEVLESWRNPLTGRTLDVWHLRNGPLNFAIDPSRPLSTGGWRLLRDVAGAAKEFQLPLVVQGDQLLMPLDAQASRRNPLKPEDWPLESTGDRLVYSEHNTWSADANEVLLRDVATPRITAAWHSHKPWRPWMLMGRTPGFIYNHLMARKIDSLDEVPAPVRAYALKHFSAFLSAPEKWSGEYVDDWSHFMRMRRPVPVPSASPR